MPGFVKVGYSMQDPQLRAKELDGTGLPLPFRVVYEALVVDPKAVETRTHIALRRKFHRPRGDREFFACQPSDAEVAIRESAGDGLLFEWPHPRNRGPDHCSSSASPPIANDVHTLEIPLPPTPQSTSGGGRVGQEPAHQLSPLDCVRAQGSQPRRPKAIFGNIPDSAIEQAVRLMGDFPGTDRGIRFLKHEGHTFSEPEMRAALLCEVRHGSEVWKNFEVGREGSRGRRMGLFLIFALWGTIILLCMKGCGILTQIETQSTGSLDSKNATPRESGSRSFA